MQRVKMDTNPQEQKSPLESLDKEEIIQKYKGLLSLAKKAKNAKDEIFEENRCLREQLQRQEKQNEVDKKALMTMKEMLEAYTENKLQLTTQVAELQKSHKLDSENVERFSIENESLKRQLQRLTEDNESLLTDIENMEGQLKQVSGLGNGQKQQIFSLEKEIAKLKEAEAKHQDIQLKNDELCHELQGLKEKYKFIKDINTEQRYKFNSLKDRFIEVHKKLKTLKECKRILLETQHEYADAVSQWQNEIIKASKVLCKELSDLREENTKLLQKLKKEQLDENVEKRASVLGHKLNELLQLSEKAKNDYHSMQEENVKLKQNLDINTALLLENSVKRLDEMWHLGETALQEYNVIRKENIMLRDHTKYKDRLDFSSQDFEKRSSNVSKLGENLALTEIETLQEKVKNLETENNFSKIENEKLLITNKSFQIERDQLMEKINILEEENIFFKKEIQDFENMKLQNVTKSPTQSHFDDSLQMKQEHLKNKQRLENLPLELKKVTEKNLEEQFSATQQILAEYKHKEIERCELIDQMRELKEYLKEREDQISRQQEEYHILKTELQTNSDKMSKIQLEIDKKDVQLNEKQCQLETITRDVEMTKQQLETLENANSLNGDKVRTLSIELENIKSNPSSSSTDFDNQSDILSTSTVSRADELQRLKDVEESFEDKYHKLRGLAAKLKKKLQEETVLNQIFEKEIQDLRKQENDLKAHILELKNKLSDMDSLHKQLNEKQNHIDSLRAENQKLKLSRKQANVLNLEIEAAEKSLTEVTSKLANRTMELEAAQESLKSKDSTITQLRKEIDLLESSKSSEINHSMELKQQVDHLNKTLKDEMHRKQQAYDKSIFLEECVEKLNLELENIKAKLAQSTSNQELALKSLNREREHLSIQLSTAQEALLDCEQKLKQAERVIEDLRGEYLEYKVKAQAVLKKNQNRDSSKEKELEEELHTMRATETRMNTTIQTLYSKIETLEKQKNLLNDDNISLQKRSKELMTLTEEIRTQNDALNKDIQNLVQQQHETLKQQRQQIECINNYHNEQIQSLNATHQRQLEQLRIELSQHIRLPTIVGITKSTVLPHHTHIDHPTDQGKLDFLLMEREDAEGSEEAAETLANLAASRKISNDFSSAKSSMQDFMPLAELLNTPLNAINSETLISNSQQNQYITDDALNAGISTDFVQLELNSTKERLQKQESRVRHLTALLAENEQDLAKLTQLNDMLKEELRRQERSVEREQHMHNSEYVKNVIMKFLTLNNADEKIRLVPVLNTILKLSRSEAEMLNCVAKGQKVAEPTQQRTGIWGNFLPWGNNSNNN